MLLMTSGAYALNEKKLIQSFSSLSTKKIQEVRIAHIKELLGHRYKRSIASTKIDKEDLLASLHQFVKKHLPEDFKNQSAKITKTIINESLKYHFDPFFLTAVISNESSFRPKANGSSGEIGLMQILPSTGKWISELYDIKWKNKNTLKDPIQNIRIGAAYINRLRNRYKHGQLYLAAYNMGPRNLKRALKSDIRPRDYTMAVMKRYFELYESISI